MHETAIVVGLMRIIERKARTHGAQKIARVRIKVGRLRAVEPQQLQSCFELFAEGTVAEGAELVIDPIEVKGRCRACGCEFVVPRFRFECPGCSGRDVEVIAGQELYVESLEATACTSADSVDEAAKPGVSQNDTARSCSDGMSLPGAPALSDT